MQVACQTSITNSLDKSSQRYLKPLHKKGIRPVEKFFILLYFFLFYSLVYFYYPSSKYFSQKQSTPNIFSFLRIAIYLWSLHRNLNKKYKLTIHLQKKCNFESRKNLIHTEVYIWFINSICERNDAASGYIEKLTFREKHQSKDHEDQECLQWESSSFKRRKVVFTIIIIITNFELKFLMKAVDHTYATVMISYHNHTA